MTNDEVIDEPARDGFELEERACGDAWEWGWCRVDDTRWPCYLDERQTINWKADRLRRGSR
jgi:hypothetical protein